jgi:hypothetical protein
MEQSELYEAWQRNKDSPQFARNYSEELRAYLSDGVTSGMPSPDASTFQWRQWLNAHELQATAELAGVDGEDCTVEVERDDGTEACGRGVPCQYHGLEGVDLSGSGDSDNTEDDETGE